MRAGGGQPALLLTPRGRLDADTCADVRHQLGAAFAAGVRSVVVDLGEVTTVDPIGLGVLAGAARHVRKKGGALVVMHASPAVQKTLRINEMAGLLLVPAATPLRGLPAPGDRAATRPVLRSGPRPLSFVPGTGSPAAAGQDVALPG